MSDLTHQRYPLKQLNIFLTNGCSLSCRHCWLTLSANQHSRDRQNLPAVFFMQAVREALPMGLQTVLLTGAEPFQHPHFDTLLEWLEKFNLNIIIETGGNGLTTQRASQLAKARNVSVSIQMDGADAETHDSIHQTSGGFDIAALAVRLLAGAGLHPQVIYTVLRRNISQIGAFVQLVEDLGAASVRFSVIQPRAEKQCLCNPYRSDAPGSNTPDEQLQIAELIALGRRVERELTCLTRLRLTFDQPPAFRGLHSNGHIEGQGNCAMLNSLSVLVNGQYALCGADQMDTNLVLGPVGADSLAKVWMGHPLLQRLRNGMPDCLEGICDRCIMKTACMGNCAADNYFRTGSFWGPYWFCDEAERAGLFPAGRLIENNW